MPGACREAGWCCRSSTGSVLHPCAKSPVPSPLQREEPEKLPSSLQHPIASYLRLELPKSWKSCIHDFFFPPCKNKTEPPSRLFPLMQDSALESASSQMEQHLQPQLGTQHRRERPCESSSTPRQRDAPSALPSPGPSNSRPQRFAKTKKKAPLFFLSRSDHSVPFSELNFRRHQRAAESWWEPTSEPRKGGKQIKPNQ